MRELELSASESTSIYAPVRSDVLESMRWRINEAINPAR
jgi:hypothetical protein